MNRIRRLASAFGAWWNSNEELPRTPPVPGRPGGKVGNSRPRASTGEELTSRNHSGGLMGGD